MARTYKKIPNSIKLFILLIAGGIAFLEILFGDVVSDFLRLKVPAYYNFSSSIKEITKINSVHDGDTINVINEDGKKVKIRLYGIDAPELKQEFGEDSRKCLEEMLKGKKIFYAVEDIDRYKRVVVTIYADNVNINYEMIKKGCAWSYFQYSKSVRNEYMQLKAKYNNIGLWAYDNPKAPWEYRQENRK